MTGGLATLLATLAAGLAAGGLLGRRFSTAAARIRELESRNEVLHKEHERALAELAVARDEARRLQREFEDYRGCVAEHFSGTSDLLRELTVQYRAVYDHLTRGASALCPEGFVGLDAEATAAALPPQSGVEAAAGERTEASGA